MDPSLVKEREAFLRRARTMQYVETPRINQQAASSSVKSSSPSPSPAKRLATNPAQRDYLTMDSRPQNQGRFALLSKVVKYMKLATSFGTRRSSSFGRRNPRRNHASGRSIVGC
uniref:Transcription initiation factor IIE subunit beta n=1 Tax=Schistocephalus solidus TaxID=70667 RepID=A0A0X3PZ67_SCHSO